MKRNLMCQARDKLSFMRGCFMGRNLRKLELRFLLMLSFALSGGEKNENFFHW